MGNPAKKLTSGKVIGIFFVVVFAIVILFNCQLWAQQEIKARVFKDVDKLFLQARTAQADILSPENYKKAVAVQEDALKDFSRGKNVDDKIEEIKKWLNLSIKSAKRAKISLAHLIKAREEALNANVIEYSRDLFEKAERLFGEATRQLEKSNVKKAKEKSLQSEKLFREAELIAIKTSIIGRVKKRLAADEKNKIPKFAPQTLGRASRLLEEAEVILNSDRSAKTDAKGKAEMADYEISHAEFLANQIKQLREDDLNWEKLILEHENYFKKICKSLSLEARFDNGFGKPTKAIIKTINSLKQQNKDLSEEISRMDQNIEKLGEDKLELQNQLSQLKEKEAGLRTKLSLEEKRKQKFKRIETLFSRDEAKVLREGENVLLRLTGLKFASGKSVIDPEYFGLLTKVQRAIRIFPDYHITIEGHTDNKGDARKNQSLSLNRARSVMSYLMANMGLTEQQISSVGFGESRPVATNETREGRARNRRIDIVLSPPNN
ncbi:MAG: OmpA family protein [Calditrichaeota bacterium]|nr:OmpA family protein [Calditrichota bacterium]